MDNELSDEELLENFPPFEVEELDKETILSDLVMDYLVALRDSSNKTRIVEKVRDKARELKAATAFNNIYKQKEREKGISLIKDYNYNTIIFPELEDTPYRTTSYKITDDGKILQSIPKLGDILVCYHPILPIEEYKNLEDGKEKINLAFYKKGHWNNIIVNKSTIASNRSIVELSDFGIEVTSENAKFLVRYLSEIANLNKEKILVGHSISRLGWINNDFIPYSEKYYYDGENKYQRIFEAIKTEGSYDKWKQLLKKLRSTSITLRFMIATSFASVLVKKLKINSFIVHLWGKSGTGKTITQMICASIWGNPTKGKLLGSLDTTDVAKERLCDFLRNFPLILDELQTTKDKDRNYDKMIYELTEGKGRDRGTKDGGLMKSTEWQNIIILSGEEPITSQTSKEGVKNRVIEIEENDTIIENGGEVVNLIENNFGFAGKEFISIIQNKDNLLDEYTKYAEDLSNYSITQKQINAIATILVADKIISELIFEDEPLTIEEIEKYFTSDVDECDRYINLIIDYANTHLNNFFKDNSNKDEVNGEIWGKLELKNDEIEYYDFIPKKLYEILGQYNISWRGIKEKMASKGYTLKNPVESEFSFNVKINGNQQRVIKIKNINAFLDT